MSALSLEAILEMARRDCFNLDSELADRIRNPNLSDADRGLLLTIYELNKQKLTLLQEFSDDRSRED